MFKLVLAFVFFLFIAVQSNPLQSTMPLHVLEEPCVRQGGLCLRIEDCDPDNLVQFGGILCPKQVHLGITCCYS